MANYKSKSASPDSTIRTNWHSLPVPSTQKSNGTASMSNTFRTEAKENSSSPSATPASWKFQQKSLEDYERDRVRKYTQYFQGNVILPIPEISKALEPQILSLVVTNLKTNKLIGLKKDTFEEILLTASIPCQYFCRCSFATWDVLLPTEEQTAKIAGSNIMTKFFQLQPQYMGTRRVRVTVYNVLAPYR